MSANDASDAMMAKAKEIAKRDGLKLSVAMEKAAIENPTLYDQVQEAGIIHALAESNDDQPAPRITKARDSFMTKVREIAKRDGIKVSVAMEKAAIEHDDLYHAMQEEGIASGA